MPEYPGNGSEIEPIKTDLRIGTGVAKHYYRNHQHEPEYHKHCMPLEGTGEVTTDDATAKPTQYGRSNIPTHGFSNLAHLRHAGAVGHQSCKYCR